jgi:hypothetical protein
LSYSEANSVIRVKAAFFSWTPPAPAGDDGSYLRWHLLDHMPEQYQLPGIQLALRYIADGEYLQSRIAANEPLADVGNLVNYLVGDPVQQTHDDFTQLGARLGQVGRFPEFRPVLQLRMPALVRWYAAPQALISAEVVPFRPHRGVVVIVEESTSDDTSSWLVWLHTHHYPALLDVPGVIGAWMYGDTTTWKLRPAAEGVPQHTTVIYLDENPLATTNVLRPLIEQRWSSGSVRPLYAAPLRTMIDWEAWR